MPLLGIQAIGIYNQPQLSGTDIKRRQTHHFSDIIVMELRKKPTYPRKLNQWIHRSGKLPINQRNGKTFTGYHIPWRHIAMTVYEPRPTQLSQEPWFPSCMGIIRLEPQGSIMEPSQHFSDFR